MLQGPAGSLTVNDFDDQLTPTDMQWRYCDVRTVGVPRGAARTFPLEGFEAALISLAASNVEVEASHPDLHSTSFTLAVHCKTDPYSRRSTLCP